MNFKRTFLAAGLLIITAICIRYLSHAENSLPLKPLSTFPKQIGTWIGQEYEFDPRVYDVLGVDESFSASYISTEKRVISLFVGFFQSQRKGDLIHSPKNCLPGAGWNITDRAIEHLTASGTSPINVKVIKLTIEKGSQKQIVFYWFQSRGRFISSEYTQKIYLVIDSLLRNRTDGTFVRLITPLGNGDERSAIRDLKEFSKQVISILQEYIPS